MFLFLVTVVTARAQVTVNASLDSLRFFVGNQDGLEIQVTFPSKSRLSLPPLRKGMEIVPNVEVVDIMPADTIVLNEGKQLQVTQRYIITAWDSAFYYLPPMEVMVDTTRYTTSPLAMRVFTVDVDTLHPDVFFPPRGIEELSFEWQDWNTVVWQSAIILLLIPVLVLLYIFNKKGKPISRMVRRKRKVPAHQVAISEIERIKQQKTWAQEDSKEYYTLLTDTLRTYIQERYGFSAMEMTSNEIIARLMEDATTGDLKELREIFRTADLVKFAKWSTQINENDANLMAALQYVNETKVEEDPNTRPEPEVVVETDRERQVQVWVVIFIQVIILLCVLFLLATIGMRLYDMFA